MLKCNKCGFENNDNTNFCINCGGELDKSNIIPEKKIEKNIEENNKENNGKKTEKIANGIKEKLSLVKKIHVNFRAIKIKYLVIIFVIFGVIFGGKYGYENYIMGGNIPKVGEVLGIKKTVDYLDFFNNNKIKIIPENEMIVMTQQLRGARNVTDFNDTNSKLVGYKAVSYQNIADKSQEEKEKEIKKHKKDIDNQISYQGKYDGTELTNKYENDVEISLVSDEFATMDLYKQDIFKTLDRFILNNTFFSSIRYSGNNFKSEFTEKLFNLFGIEKLIDNIFDELSEDNVIEYEMIGLDYENKNAGNEEKTLNKDTILTLRLKYKLKDVYKNKEESNEFLKGRIEDRINDFLSSLGEKSVIIKNNKNYDLKLQGDILNIKIDFILYYDSIKNSDDLTYTLLEFSDSHVYY